MSLLPGAEERRLATLQGRSWGWAVVCARFDREEAAAVLQEAYRCLLFGNAEPDGSPFLVSLLGVIRQVARRRRRAAVLRAAADLLLRGWVPSRQEERPDSGLVWDRRARELAELLLALPRREREVVALVFGEELPVDQAARVLDVSERRAGCLLARGAERLQERLGAPSAPAGDAGERRGGRR